MFFLGDRSGRGQATSPAQIHCEINELISLNSIVYVQLVIGNGAVGKAFLQVELKLSGLITIIIARSFRQECLCNLLAGLKPIMLDRSY